MSDVSKGVIGEVIWHMLRHLEEAEEAHGNDWACTFSLQQRVSLIMEELGELSKEVNDLDEFMRCLSKNNSVDAKQTVCNITEEAYQLLSVVLRFVLTWYDEQVDIQREIRNRENEHVCEST